MKKPTNKQIVNVLIRARGALKWVPDDAGHTYICNAILATCSQGQSKAAQYLRHNIILARLGRMSSITKQEPFCYIFSDANRDFKDWLLDVAKVPANDLTYERVQAHRHAWVDMLIEEFSK